MIKLLDFRPLGPYQLELRFSDQARVTFDGAAYLTRRRGPLLEPLHDPVYFTRCFIEAGALCWPNGLELSAARLRELVPIAQAV